MEVITTYSDQEPALVEVHFSLKPRDWYKLEKKPYWKRVEEYLSEHYCNEMKNENIQKNRSNQSICKSCGTERRQPMKKALVRRKRHQLPMLSVLIRYQIGRADQYGRGRWITEADLPLIKAGMEADPSKITNVGGMPCLLVNGSKRHNQVEMADFAELFTSEGGTL